MLNWETSGLGTSDFRNTCVSTRKKCTSYYSCLPWACQQISDIWTYFCFLFVGLTHCHTESYLSRICNGSGVYCFYVALWTSNWAWLCITGCVLGQLGAWISARIFKSQSLNFWPVMNATTLERGHWYRYRIRSYTTVRTAVIESSSAPSEQSQI